MRALEARLVERRRVLESELEQLDREVLDAPCPMTTRVQRLYERRLRIKREIRELEAQLDGSGDAARGVGGRRRGGL